MKRALSKRVIIRIISFTIAFISAITAVKIISNREVSSLKTEITNTMNGNFDELITSVNNINISLEKGLYCGTANQLTSLSAELWKESGAAKSALAQLPFSENELTTINKFLSQIGDYSMYISKKMLNGQVVSEDERMAFSELSAIGRKISDGLSTIGLSYSGSDGWANEINALLNSKMLEQGFGNSLAQLDETLTDYPTLVYDGPFSDKVEEEYAKALAGQDEVSKESARNRAAFALSVSAESLLDDTDEGGTLPSYGFKTKDGTYITVSKQGGQIVYFRKYNQITETNITADEAVEKAYNFLSQMGDTAFVESYYYIDEGVCTINFAYKLGDFTCYSDLIKVGVALDNGSIVLMDARGYLMNHTDRTVPSPQLTIAEAQTVISPILSVEKVGHAIIPSNSTEKACYEFLCAGVNGEEVLVYVNCDTLVEEKILILLKSDGGTLTK